MGTTRASEGPGCRLYGPDSAAAGLPPPLEFRRTAAVLAKASGLPTGWRKPLRYECVRAAPRSVAAAAGGRAVHNAAKATRASTAAIVNALA